MNTIILNMSAISIIQLDSQVEEEKFTLDDNFLPDQVVKGKNNLALFMCRSMQ